MLIVPGVMAGLSRAALEGLSQRWSTVMTASKNSEVWVVMRVDSLAEVGNIPTNAIAKIEHKRRPERAGSNDFAAAMRQVEDDIY